MHMVSICRGGFGGLFGETVDQARMQCAGRQHAAAAGGQLDQVLGAAGDDRQERLVDGDDQDRAAIVRLERFVVVELGHLRADVVAQRARAAAAFAELPGQAGQQVGGRQVAPAPGRSRS